jgi:hypothetical protein
MMEPTLCHRCGGHKDRCECADLRREGMEMAAKAVESGVYLLSIGTPGEGPFTRQDRVCLETREQAAAAIRALARKPDRPL